MKSSYTIFLIFACLSFFMKTDAQKRLDYKKDVYDAVLNDRKENAYTLLLAYQKQDPDFANTYFQLGLIAHEWAYDFNPFTEFYLMKLFIYNTKLYYNLAKFKMDDEKRRNREYYENAVTVEADSKLTIDDIQLFLEKKTDEIETFELNIVNIINFFNLSSDHYNECVNIFMNINKEYSKIKHIYLTETPEFNKNLTELEQHFDSALYYFEKYKTALKKFPIEGYDQIYVLKDILTYRLDGLTYSDFLKNKITLWNYKKWASNVRQMKSESVSSVRQELIEEDKLIKTLINKTEGGGYTDTYTPYILDKRLIYKIEKFDNNSPAVHLLKVNTNYLNCLRFFNQSLNDPENDSIFSFRRYLQFVNEFAEMKMICEKSNARFIQNVSEDHIQKYPVFYSTQYKGKNGLVSYSENLEKKLSEKFRNVSENLKVKHIQEQYLPEGKVIRYKHINTIVKSQCPKKEEMKVDEYFTERFTKKKDGTYIISGRYKNRKGTLAGFIGRTKDLQSCDMFVRSAASDTSDIFFSLIEPTDNGFYAIQTSVGNTISNVLIQFSNSGREQSRRSLPYNEFPSLMSFDDIRNVLSIVFSGKTDEQTKEKKESQTIVFLHFNENEESPVLKLEGNLSIVDILLLNNTYLIFNNFTHFKDVDGTVKYSKAGTDLYQTNVLVSTADADGLLLKHIPIEHNRPFFGTDAVKINSDLINLLGFSADYKSYKPQDLKNKQLLFFMLNSDLGSINKAWHD